MKTIEQMSTKALLSKVSGVPEREYVLECKCILHLGGDQCRFTIYFGEVEHSHVLVKRFNKDAISVAYFDSFEEAVKRMAIRCSNIW